MPATKTINIRIPKELEQELLTVSKEENIPLSDIVRMSLRRFMSIRRFKRLHKKTIGYARRAGLVNEDEILNLK